MHLKQKLAILILFSIATASCNSEKITLDQSDSSLYFPLNLYDTISYFIEEKNYTINGIDSSQYYEKHIITNESEDYFFINVYSKYENETSYTLTENYSIATQNGEYTENRNNYIKLILSNSTEIDHEFDQNKFNNDDERTLIVTQNNDISIPEYNIECDLGIRLDGPSFQNLIDEQNYIYVFQENKGLIFSVEKNLSTQPGESTIGHEKTIRRID